MAGPQRNTIMEDIAAFQAERLKFLEDQRKFRVGDARYGVAAASSLLMLYKELIYSTHKEGWPDEAAAFISDLSKFYSMAALLTFDQNLMPDSKGKIEVQMVYRNPNFMAAINKLDELDLKMRDYKRKCGFG